MDNGNNVLRHIAIIQDENEADVLRKLNDAVDEHGIKIIDYSKDRITKEDSMDKVWRIEIFYEGPGNIFDYDFKGSYLAKLNTSDASKSHSR